MIELVNVLEGVQDSVVNLYAEFYTKDPAIVAAAVGNGMTDINLSIRSIAENMHLYVEYEVENSVTGETTVEYEDSLYIMNILNTFVYHPCNRMIAVTKAVYHPHQHVEIGKIVPELTFFPRRSESISECEIFVLTDPCDYEDGLLIRFMNKRGDQISIEIVNGCFKCSMFTEVCNNLNILSREDIILYGETYFAVPHKDGTKFFLTNEYWFNFVKAYNMSHLVWDDDLFIACANDIK